jgi:hypothetical protein
VTTALPLPAVSRFGVMFNQVPIGWHQWPQAAQRVATVILEEARLCRLLPDGLRAAFVLSDPMIGRILRKLGKDNGDEQVDRRSRFGVLRRCIQKGLKQLEDLGAIRRFRQAGARWIRFLIPLSGSGKTGGTSKPAKSSPAPSQPAAEKPPDPDPVPDHCPERSPAEIQAQIQADITAERNSPRAPAPAEVAPPVETSRKRLRFTAPPKPVLLPDDEEEATRKANEMRNRALAYLATKKRIGSSDQPAAPAAPGEIARE